MTLLRIDKPGEYNLGEMTAGTVPIKDQVIDVTAPDVTIIGLNGHGMRRAESDPVGDNDWQAFVRVRSTAARCTIAESLLDDNDVISIRVDGAPNFTLENSEIMHTGCGVFFNGAAQSRILNSAIHKIDRMLRNTPTAGDDTGAMCVAYKDAPRNSTRHKLLGSYLGEAISYSNDYGWNEGAGVEIYQASSIEVNGCVLLDLSVTTESGSKSPIQIYDIHFLNNYIGALELIADEKYRRGLGLRPMQNSRITGNRYFDLDHWDTVIGWGSQTYGYGTNGDLVFSGNQHACTRNSKAYSYNGNGGTAYTVDPAQTILYGSAAQPLATQFRKEAIAKRDLILAGSGLGPSTPPVPVPPTDSAILERIAALEAGLKAEESARMAADSAEQQARVATDIALDHRLDAIAGAAGG